MTHRIVIVDDQQILRDGLRSLLEKQPEFEVVGEAADGKTAAALIEKCEPDLVIMDITMPGLNGIEATRRIVRRCPSVKVIALSVHADREFARRMFDAGARGYLPKDCTYDELIKAVRCVATGKIYISPQIVDGDREGAFLPPTKRCPEEFGEQALSSTAREILQLVAEGKTTREIAEELHLSVKSVEKYRHRIMEKLGLHSVADLTKYAVLHGITPLQG